MADLGARPDSSFSLPPRIYDLWQRPFMNSKLQPLLQAPQFTKLKSLLELGCGSGTNRPFFPVKRYCGLDIDPAMIELAKKRNASCEFLVADITASIPDLGDFDGVLIHSVLHHLTDESVIKVGSKLSIYLKPDGKIFIADAILDSTSLSLRNLMARLDKGNHFRLREHWQSLLNNFVNVEHYEEFDLRILGIPLYRMFLAIGSLR
jgi:SAM-dependent methyltransferase